MTDTNSRPLRLGVLVCGIVAFCSTARAEEDAARKPLSKVYTEEEAWQLGWPFLYGPFGNFVPAQTGVDLVHDLANARLVWESEDNDFGRAKHTTGTFKAPGKLTQHLGPDAPSHPGGWAGPIIADGKLFGTSFRPSGPVLDVKRYAGLGGTEKARLEAEDLVIALDVKTGKTVWKAVESGGFVWGVGKRHGFQVAPTYHEGKVFSMGTTGRLFAYKAATGERLWQTPGDPRMVEERKKWLADPRGAQAVANYGWQQSLTVAGGVLIVPDNSRLVGRDIDTGETKWQLDRVISSWATPNVWRHEGREFLLAATVASPGHAEMRLIDPQEGEVLWTVGDLHATHFTLSPSENHVLVNVGSSISTQGNASAPKDEQGKAYYGRLGCYRISPEGAKLVWEFPDKPQYVHSTWFDVAAMRRVLIRNGLVYYASRGPDKEADRRIVIARAETGEILVDQPQLGGSYMHLIEDCLLHAPDWAHGGRATFNLYKADPADFRKLSGPWAPELALTTAYTVNMEAPVVAGRIFLRTEKGTVLCYDLRDTAELKQARADLKRISSQPEKEAIPALVAMSQSPHVKTQRMAVDALSEYGPAAAPAIAVLIEYLDDEALEVREAARDALTSTGPPAVERLTQAARDLSSSAANSALLALVRIGPTRPLPKDLIQPLIQLMRSAGYDDAYGAATLLARIGAPALPPLMTLVGEEHIPGSGRAAWAIGEMGATAKPAIKTLDSIGGSTTDHRLQGMIREAIGKISG